MVEVWHVTLLIDYNQTATLTERKVQISVCGHVKIFSRLLSSSIKNSTESRGSISTVNPNPRHLDDLENMLCSPSEAYLGNISAQLFATDVNQFHLVRDKGYHLVFPLQISPAAFYLFLWRVTRHRL